MNQKHRRRNNELLLFAMAMSQRDQYVCGKSVVDIACPAVRGAVSSPAVMVGAQAPTDSHADLRQAEYFYEVLGVLRAGIQDELAHHCVSLELLEADGDRSGVRRSQRIIHAKEAELARIGQLTDALSTRFPTSSSRTHCHETAVSSSHRVPRGLSSIDVVQAAMTSAKV